MSVALVRVVVTCGRGRVARSSTWARAARVSVPRQPKKQAARDPNDPSNTQLRAHFIQSAVPMLAFGFMDNTVMIHAGNAIDLTMGVTFGLATMTAAACGQVCSDLSGVLFGGVIENTARRLGLPTANLTPQQQYSKPAMKTENAGKAIGVVSGCTLGLVNLLLIDTSDSTERKAVRGSQLAGFCVEVSNEDEEITCVTVTGPGNVNGVIASITNQLTMERAVIKQIIGSRSEDTSAEADYDGIERLEVKLYLQRDGEQIDDEELPQLTEKILAACSDPQALKALRDSNDDLRLTVTRLTHETEMLEDSLADMCVTVTKSPTGQQLDRMGLGHGLRRQNTSIGVLR